jgi:ZIP family zinc transporter
LNDVWTALLLSLMAGISIPFGAALAGIDRVRPSWLDEEVRHTVAAFGGGALFAAIAFVLLPEASSRLGETAVVLWFLVGGIVFFGVDHLLERHGGAGATFLAMMLDYVPEALALGALIAGRPDVALLTATLIALQNLPESFTAYREIIRGGAASRWHVFLLFAVMVPIGPLAALTGLFVLADQPNILGAIMAFAAGGILYLLFEDVAPQAPLANRPAPPLGAVAGFALGLAGHLMVG